MNGPGKSDRLVVAKKDPNKGDVKASPAESLERRSLAKGNPLQETGGRTPLPGPPPPCALERIREAAKGRRGERFTTLWHHVYDVERLREAYFALRRTSAPGVDGETWESYGRTLEGNLEDLSGRLKRGAYRAKPVRRVYIPKGDGRERPIGVPVLEDKIVQRATVEVLNAIYETDFKGFSHGFRPGRNPHNALDALTVGIEQRPVNWVLDADVRAFFDSMDHEWLIRFIEHRIADRRVVRHIRKWLRAGVLEKERWEASKAGTPQGGSISPLLANVYLHYVFDLWADRWRKREAQGAVILVRYADDIVVGFQYREDAERFRHELEQRLSGFALSLHQEKTRLIEFGRNAIANRRARGEGRPESFDFLGFTHLCATSRKGRFWVQRRTSRKKMRAKLQTIRQRLRKQRHQRVPETGRWLRSVLLGHYRYYGVRGNYRMLAAFQYHVLCAWYRMLNRRSQRRGVTARRMERYAHRWLPGPTIHHPYPFQRLCVST
jgi:RNA-directed DNA polymerase